VRCEECGFIQVEKPIDANKIYKEVDYLYFSSDMPGLSEYFREYATDVHDRLASSGFVVEIGSNDGILLEHFATFGHTVLGVDPATNVAVRALARGIPTIPLFFTERLAKMIRAEMGQAKVICANNCIAHIDDLDDVMKGVEALLDTDGVFVVECNYWGGMVKNTNYALVYHDHFSYFSLIDWVRYAEEFGLRVFDATVTPAQGGSLRVFMARNRALTKRFNELIKEEDETNLNSKETAEAYGRACIEEAKKLSELVKGLRKDGKRIAGYGAAAKGFSVLKLAGIGADEIEYFVDDSPAKQGKYTPEHNIPIIARYEAEEKLPDYFFITAPNYADTIIEKERERGFKGRFILCDSRIVE